MTNTRTGSLGLHIRWVDGCPALALRGRIDAGAAELVGEAVAALLETEPRLLLDLAGVAVVDGVDAAPIEDVLRAATASGGDVVVINPPSLAARQFTSLSN